MGKRDHFLLRYSGIRLKDTATCFLPCSFPLMWLESREETCIIKIQLIAVGNAVVTFCVLKMDVDAKC